MKTNAKLSSQPEATLPADDLKRNVTIARPDHDNSLRHFAVAGDTYTILLTGADTAGRYCLIDMFVPPGGGPPPHRHDFEEMFSMLEGEIEITFRGEKSTLRAGETINVPANAPHSFTNVANVPARMLCLCSPAGQEEFFAAIGDPVDSRTSVAPKMSGEEQAERIAKVRKLAPLFKTEMLGG